MEARNAQARRHLDKRYDRLRPLLKDRPPHRGWIRGIRDALGMSGPELATRMGVTQSTISDLEASEMHGTIKLDTLRRAAEALDCEVAYFLVPRTTLTQMVADQAHRKASIHLNAVAHHGRLEDQELDPVASNDELEAFASGLVDRRGLWAGNPG
jgi:predicted DNA-binding mobile mystery protein A